MNDPTSRAVSKRINEIIENIGHGTKVSLYAEWTTDRIPFIWYMVSENVIPKKDEEGKMREPRDIKT